MVRSEVFKHEQETEKVGIALPRIHLVSMLKQENKVDSMPHYLLNSTIFD